MQIEEKPAFGTPFEWIGGESKVRALVDRFYDLMDLEPAYAALRAVHGSDLANARQRLFWFLCGWLGGPQHYVERFGHPRIVEAIAYRRTTSDEYRHELHAVLLVRATNSPAKVQGGFIQYHNDNMRSRYSSLLEFRFV